MIKICSFICSFDRAMEWTLRSLSNHWCVPCRLMEANHQCDARVYDLIQMNRKFHNIACSLSSSRCFLRGRHSNWLTGVGWRWVDWKSEQFDRLQQLFIILRQFDGDRYVWSKISNCVNQGSVDTRRWSWSFCPLTFSDDIILLPLLSCSLVHQLRVHTYTQIRWFPPAEI